MPDASSVAVVLTCRECGAKDRPRAWFALTKTGVFRLEGSTSFYLDGAGALCPDHVPVPRPTPQTETWTDYDRASAEALAES